MKNINPKQKLLSKKKVVEIFKIWQNNNPSPTTELKYQNGFQLLIAVILSAQATDKSVNLACEKLFKDVKTPEDLATLGESKIIPYIKSIGLFRSKAKNLNIMAGQLINKFNSQIPNEELKLRSLAGVGIKTAQVILNTLFDKPTIAVDTHVFRVCNRLGICYEETPEKLSQILPKAIPESFHRYAHHWLILHGRYTCLARNPLCKNCNVKMYCNFTLIKND